MLDGMSKVGILLVAATHIRVSGAKWNNFREKAVTPHGTVDLQIDTADGQSVDLITVDRPSVG
jgi:hypothetical protein